MSGTATVVLAAIATCAAAPLSAAVLVRVCGERVAPRLPAVTAFAIALVAGGTLAWGVHTGDGAAVAWGPQCAGGTLVYADGLTALLLPTIAAILLAIALAAPRHDLGAPAAVRLLVGGGLTLALVSTAHPAALVALWAATAWPTWAGARATPGGRGVARIYAIALAAAIPCIAIGTALVVADPPWLRAHGAIGDMGGWLVAVAVMIRKGIVPFHSWYPAVFRGAGIPTALAATMPQVASYTAVRLLVGHADGVAIELVVLANAALVTAAYGAALAAVQRDARGLVGMLAMSQSAMVLAGLAGSEPLELCGALATWVSSGVALTGIALVTAALEGRAGPLAIDVPQGRFADAPALSVFFLLFGLASLGLPGTLSFVADDLLVSGALADHLHAGILVVVATVFAGIAVMRGWFRICGGPATSDAPRHPILPRERAALTALLAVLVALGTVPGPLVRSLEGIATSLLASRAPLRDPSFPGADP